MIVDNLCEYLLSEECYVTLLLLLPYHILLKILLYHIELADMRKKINNSYKSRYRHHISVLLPMLLIFIMMED